VSVRGEFFAVDGAHIGPLRTKPLDIWLGGSARTRARTRRRPTGTPATVRS